MTIWNKGDKVGDFIIDAFIKSNYAYEESYLVRNDKDEKFLLKAFDMSATPANRLKDNEPIEISVYKDIKCQSLPTFLTHGHCNVKDKIISYYLRAFVGGETVADKLADGKVYKWEEAIPIIKCVLDALNCMLESLPPVVHNDINPNNIIVSIDQEGREHYYLIGMGHLANYSTGVASFEIRDLNPWYRAPETYKGMYDSQSDVFSVGVLLFKLLSGLVPWDNGSIDTEKHDLAMRKEFVKNARKVALDYGIVGELTENEVEILKKAIALDYDKRFRNSRTFLNTIEGKIELKKESETPGKMEENIFTTLTQQQEEDSTSFIRIEKHVGGGFADVAGMEEIKQIFYKNILFILKNKEKVEKYKLKVPNGALLYGPPGCGKTYIAEKFAQESGLNFMMVKASDLGSIYIHGSQGKISELFIEAEKKAPTVLCFDEFEAMVPDRSKVINEGHSGEVNEFLSQLNNCSQRGIFVIGTSNRPEKIDPAVLRTGRIDKLIYIPLPDEEAREQLFNFYLKDRWCDESINCKELSQISEGCISSDITFVTDQVALNAAMDDLPITQQMLKEEVNKARRSVTKDQLKEYESIRKRIENNDALNGNNRIGFATYSKK